MKTLLINSLLLGISLLPLTAVAGKDSSSVKCSITVNNHPQEIVAPKSCRLTDNITIQGVEQSATAKYLNGNATCIAKNNGKEVKEVKSGSCSATNGNVSASVAPLL